MQEGEHSAADVGASKGRPDKDLAQGGFPSNAHDSFSVTPLLTKVGDWHARDWHARNCAFLARSAT